jgi:hypothetical protein
MIGEEVLFKDKGWSIWGIPGYEDMFDTVYHKCPWTKNWLLKNKPISTYEMKKMQTCMHCGEDIPDSIMGIWKLKNFDLLSEEEAFCSNSNSNIFIGYKAGLNTGSHNVFIGGIANFYMGSGKLLGRPGQVWEYKP